VPATRKSTRSELLIVGGGPAGSLLAIFAARHGIGTTVVERDREHRPAAEGRSINLALAARGIEALREAGVFSEVEHLLIPMRGRMVHEIGAAAHLLPYGQGPGEQIYSLSRAALNVALREAARRRGVGYLFGHECTGVDVAAQRLSAATANGPASLRFDALVAADGAGSTVRRVLRDAGFVRAQESLLDHGYKELGLPAAADGGYALAANALHIWPRGDFMLIALPNLNGSFTATLFLALEGKHSFAALGPDSAEAFFTAHFPDALPLMPDFKRDFAEHPVGTLGTVSCAPWSVDGRVVLLGDAAHAIVPFHGQGMNAAFEDCSCFDRLLEAHGPDWSRVFEAFETERRDDARAIAEMALENYREMRETVRDPRFELRAQIAFELERRFPGRFVPRYSMVMFHPEIGYAEAQRRGRLQSRILDELSLGAADVGDVDFERARGLIERRL
jgi:kynurenine 3-monooxygenase